MDREAWQATVHGVARVRHDLVTKPPPQAGHILLKRLQKILLISCYVPQPPLPPKFSRGHTVCALQYFDLENLMDKGACLVTDYL